MTQYIDVYVNISEGQMQYLNIRLMQVVPQQV